MEDLKFNIQLFAEGEEPAVEDTPAVEQPEVDSEQEQQEDFDWSINPETGDVTFDPRVFDDAEDSEGEPPVQEEKPEEQPEAQPEPQKYTVKIDGVEQEVTLDELMKGYMKGSDYTRKTQALAEERRQLQSMYGQRNPNMGQPQQPVQPPEPPKPSPKDYYKNLSEYAVKEVSKELGEEYDEYNPIHQAALADVISTVKARMYERNVGQQQIQSVYDKYAQDPNFADIDRYAAQRLQQLPYQQAVQIQNALRSNNAKVVDAYMAAVRDEYYRSRGYIPAEEAQKAKEVPVATPAKPVQKAKPPFAEPTGVAKQNVQTTKNLDYSKLGKMTLDQQAQIAAKLGLG